MTFKKTPLNLVFQFDLFIIFDLWIISNDFAANRRLNFYILDMHNLAALSWQFSRLRYCYYQFFTSIFRYKQYMTNVVSGNMALARRGGIPGTLPLVSSFVGLRTPAGSQGVIGLEDGLVDNRPLWPQLYYCLRCGDVAAALACAQQAG